MVKIADILTAAADLPRHRFQRDKGSCLGCHVEPGTHADGNRGAWHEVPIAQAGSHWVGAVSEVILKDLIHREARPLYGPGGKLAQDDASEVIQPAGKRQVCQHSGHAVPCLPPVFEEENGTR